MRIQLLIITFFFSVTGLLAGNPGDTPDSVRYWKLISTGMFNLNQVALSNWAEGGESSISGSAIGSLKASYLKEGFKFDQFANLAYGLTWNREQQWRKSDDKFDVGTTVGYQAFDQWYYSLMVNLKSQFSPGFKYPDDSTLVSDFMSPGRLFLSFGLEYKPDPKTSVFISPASGKFVFVLNDELANKGAYGVTPAVRDTAGNIIVPGLHYNPKFGMNLVVAINRELMKNVNVDTKLNLHNNYMDAVVSNRWNFDMNWETAFNFKINSFLSSMLFLHLMYDHDVMVPYYEKVEGEKVKVGEGPRLQVKENFGIGVTIKV
ncbi:MAG: DUF3078 domain-containing protein [Bacteroidales bacterium]